MVYQELSYGSFPTGERAPHDDIARRAPPGALLHPFRFLIPHTAMFTREVAQKICGSRGKEE